MTPSNARLHFQNIYNNHVSEYDELVSHEDYCGNLWKALDEVASHTGKAIVEFGAGTGRLTLKMAESAASIIAFDESSAMIASLTHKLSKKGIQNCKVGIADNRALPISAECADLAIEGWALGHLTAWDPLSWRDELDKAVSEMKRVVKTGGKIVIIETLGTGLERPQAPDKDLAEMYQILEEKHGFQFKWIRTDYQFSQLEQANRIVKLFFGKSMLEKFSGNEKVILPECTGVWFTEKS